MEMKIDKYVFTNFSPYLLDKAAFGKRSIQSALINKLLTRIAGVRGGIAIFSASSAQEFSYEDKKWGGGHGVFTYYLVTGLRGAADANADGIITIRELYDYVYRKVAESTGGKQHPELKGNFDNSLPLSVIK